MHLSVGMARKKNNFQIKLEYYVASFFATLLRVLPRKLAIFLGIRLGDIAYLLLGKLRNTALKNTEIAYPEKSLDERKKLVLGCFRNLGRQLGEISQFPKATPESLEKMVDFPITNEEWQMYRDFKEQGRGVIYLTPHFGGWEVLAFASSAFIGPQNYLVRKMDNPQLEKMVADLRGKFGNKPLDKTNSVLSVLKILKDGGDLGILPDLNSQEKEGVFVPFFGKLACTTSGVATLAMRTNAVVIVLCAFWDENLRKYVVDVSEVLEFEKTKNRKGDIKNFTARFTKAIENLIRKHPEQWLWIHKRWKTRPKGEEQIY